MIGRVAKRCPGRPWIHTLVSEETVRPSSPTPPHLKTYRLSLIDSITPSLCMPMVLFYPKCPEPGVREMATRLKYSLSQTLTQYYPFSGRLVAGGTVDCSDEGVHFSVAQMDVDMFGVVNNPDRRNLDQFFPMNHSFNGSGELLAVRLTSFASGGTVVAVSLSHKIGDANTLCTFADYWASKCRGGAGGVDLVPPHFLPPSSSAAPKEVKLPEWIGYITKRFVLSNAKLQELKVEIGVANTSRVEAVAALLHKCYVDSTTTNTNSGKGSRLVLAANMRDHLQPPLPRSTVGNICKIITAVIPNNNEMTLQTLVRQIKEEKAKFMGMTYSELEDSIVTHYSSPHRRLNSMKTTTYSSFCGSPLNRIDFGWGLPVRAAVLGYNSPNTFVLLDTPGDCSIEALVTLREEEMALFQSHRELLTYSTGSV